MVLRESFASDVDLRDGVSLACGPVLSGTAWEEAVWGGPRALFLSGLNLVSSWQMKLP